MQMVILRILSTSAQALVLMGRNYGAVFNSPCFCYLWRCSWQC